jgi:malonyl-CoA O-methyltransferase
MHDYGDMLVECGFADPVMDAEVLTMTYASLDDLLADLRRSGSACAMQARRRGLTGRSTWAATRAAYERSALRGSPAGDRRSGLRTRLEIAATKMADGRTIVRFDPQQRAADAVATPAA